MQTPDKWIILKIGTENPIYKVFATWYGGYLGNDSWKINSGINKVEEDDSFYYFYGYSGSCYKCHKKTYGTNFYSKCILDNILDKSTDVSIMEEFYDFKTLNI